MQRYIYAALPGLVLGATLGVAMFWLASPRRSHAGRRPASILRATSLDSVSSPPDFVRPPAEVFVLSSVAEVDEAVAAIEASAVDGYTVVGLDAEWRPSTGPRSTEAVSPLAILQLSTRSAAYVIALQQLGPTLPPSLVRLLVSPRVFKAGVGIAGDARKLRKDFGVAMRGAVELGSVAIARGRGHQGLSLRALCFETLGLTLAKERGVQLSDWQAWPLSDEQIFYAAADAHVGLLIVSALVVDARGVPLDGSALAVALGALADTKIKGRHTTSTGRVLACKPTDASRAVVTGRNPYGRRVAPLYDNCRILSPDGVLLCSVSRKKVDWYLARGLAEIVPEADAVDERADAVSSETAGGALDAGPSVSIRLLFEPKGLGHAGDPFYMAPKVNLCVVCGSGSDYNRYHVVPLAYRRHFPEDLKTHSSHDIVLVCKSCLLAVTLHADELKRQIAAELDVPLDGIGPRYVEDADAARALAAAQLLAKHKGGRLEIPAERVASAMAEVERYFDSPFTDLVLADALRLKTKRDNPEHVPHGLALVSRLDGVDALHAFSRRWRAHFVTRNAPRALPAHWSVDFRETDARAVGPADLE